MGKWINFVKLLNVEPYMFMMMVTMTIKMSINGQLYQDKICINDLGHPIDVCRTISTTTDPALEQTLSAIIVTANRYSVYQTMVFTVPGVIFSLFIGSWSDKYPSGRKMLMVFGAIGSLLDGVVAILNVINFSWPTWLMLLSIVPSTMSGGAFGMLTAVHSHAAKETPDELKTLRFAVLEVVSFAASPVTQLASGYLIEMDPWFYKNLVRNYLGVYAIGSSVAFLAMIWAMLVVEDNPRPLMKQISVMTNDSMDTGLLKEDEDKSTLTHRWVVALRNLFDWRHVRDMFKVVLKKRPEQKRTQIMLLLLAHNILVLCYLGPTLSVLFGYVQKVFHWDIGIYTRVSSFFTFLNIGTTMMFTWILSKVLQWKDISIAMIGAVSVLLIMVVRGSILTLGGLYLSYTFGIVGMLTFVAARSMIAKVVEPAESGSVFAVLASLESCIPLVGATMFTSIFNATIDWAPGIVWHFAGLLCIPGIAMLAILDLISSKYVDQDLGVSLPGTSDSSP